MNQIQYRLDTSGNLLIAPDTATTSAKHVALTLIACAAMAGCEVASQSDSPIKDVSYDVLTHTLSWSEQGQDGTQSVTINNPSLINLLGTIMQDHQVAESTETIAQAVVEALPTAQEIAAGVAEQLQLSTTLDGVTTRVTAELQNSVVPRLRTIDAKADSIIEMNTRRKSEKLAPEYLKGGI